MVDSITLGTDVKDVLGTGLSLKATTGLGVSTVVRQNARQGGAVNGSISRFYTVTPPTKGEFSNIGFNYLSHEIGTIDENEISLWESHNDGIVWDSVTATRDITNNVVQGVNVNMTSNSLILTLADSACDVLPTVDLGPDQTVCSGVAVTLDAKNQGLTYFWNTKETTQTIVADQAGTYWVAVTNANGCVGFDTIEVIEKNYPVADFDQSFVCQGVTSAFSSTSTIDEGGLTYRWDFGVADMESDTSILAAPTFTYDTSDLYTVQLIVTSDFECRDTVSKEYVVHGLPVPNFSVEEVCLDSLTLFKDASSIRSSITTTTTPVQVFNYAINSYAWDFGDASTLLDISSEESPSYTYANEGSYQVKLVLTSNTGCKDSMTLSTTIHPEAVANFTVDSVCFGNESTFQNLSSVSSGDLSYAWSFGDATTSTATTPSRTYQSTGTHTISLVATTDFGCKDTTEEVTAIYEIPEASFSISDTCMGDEVSLQNSSTIAPMDASTDALTYAWDLGNGDVSIAENPSVRYDDATSYQVALTVSSDHGCLDTHTATTEAYPIPTADFNFLNACDGEEIRYFNTSAVETGTNTYQWSFGDGDHSTNLSPSHLFDSEGTYDTRLIAVSNRQCRDTIFQTVEAYALPIINIQDEITTCAGQFILDAENTGASYLWQDNSSAQTFTATQTGNYEVKVTDTNGCIAEQSTFVTLNSVFVPNLEPIQTACDELALDAGNLGALSYEWSTGENSKIITVNTSGTYTVEIEDQNGCPGSQDIQVTINTSPTVNLGADQEFCEGISTTLDAANVGNAYLWSDGSTAQTIAVNSTGTYDVKVTTPQGCYDADTVAITVNELPVVDLGSDRQACDQTTLDAENEGASYLWSDGSSAQYVEVSTTGSYEVTVTDNNGCQQSDAVNITVEASPVFSLGEDQDLCSGEATTLRVGLSGLTYLWSDGSTADSLVVRSSGEYSVAVTNALNCTSQDAAYVTVHSKVAVDLGAETESICSGNTLVIDAGLGGQGNTYAWTADSLDFTAATQVVALSEEGLYKVTVTTPIGCVGEDSIQLNVNTDTLLAKFLAISEAPMQQAISFINISTPITADFVWQMGDGYQSTLQDLDHAYFSEGTYTVSLTATNGVCTHTQSKEITILPLENSTTLNQGENQEEEIPIADEGEIISSSKVYPNPVEDVFVLKLELASSGEVTLILSRLSGHVLERHHYQDIAELSKEFDLSNTASGMYLLHVVTPKDQKLMKIIKK